MLTHHSESFLIIPDGSAIQFENTSIVNRYEVFYETSDPSERQF
jgi:hypothetical protein